MEHLTRAELEALVQRAFGPSPDEEEVLILVDLPDREVPDTPAWRSLRDLAASWAAALDGSRFRCRLFGLRNARRNNADLPGVAWPLDPGRMPGAAEDLDPSAAASLEDLLASRPLVLAPTRFSATAPLKRMAARIGFRGATLPGFTSAMVPALRLDLEEVHRRVERLAALLDEAAGARLRFLVDGREPASLFLDLRHRQAHRSSGLLRAPGQVGNLPSGEAYIVPYEGEGEPSRSEGVLPVELDGEVVRYRVTGNRAVAAEGEGPVAAREREVLAREPAYGNLAELGLGVLSEMGIDPVGEVLLDEKLGLHVAFGRSDHFGGRVGPGDFTAPEAVVHADRVYLPSLQPRVRVPAVDLVRPDGTTLPLMRDGRYVA
ncbi:hypothetical protein KBD49_07360 [Myxococcota bacterium]|jgi:hypothetical protein|nr:hypothetical protein [Myxococcota bacterium]